MISLENLIKKHYILQVKKINPFNSDKCFYSYEAFGIECGKGWYDLLDKLCTKIEKELDKDESLKKDFLVTQIKEKFGGLRFYVGSATDKIFKIIDKYENKSYKVCENCGKKGKNRSLRGWTVTICNKCAKPRVEQWKKDIIETMSEHEKEVNILLQKAILTKKQKEKLSDLQRWMDICEKNLVYINKNFKA